MKTNLTMKQLGEKIAELSQKGHIAYEEAGADLDFSKVKVFGEGDTKSKVEKLQALNAELKDLNEDYQAMVALQGARESVAKSYQPADAPQKKEEGRKSIGEMFLKSKAFKQKGITDRVDIDVKTLFESAAGWDPEATRIGRVSLYPTRPLSVLDFVPQGPTGMDTVRYMKESTFTNNAAEAAAGATYGEAALVYTETSDEVEKIGVWLPCTDEQLEDVVGMPGFLNQRLTYMLKAKLEAEVLEGSGTTPALWGAKSLAAVQTQAKGADPTPDAYYKAFTLVRGTGFAEPSVLFVNPNDWQETALLRTADGIYIMGNPTDPTPKVIWGVPVCVTTACTEATAICGDFTSHSMLYTKRGIDFQVTNAHSDYFIKGKQAIRCDMRCAMVFFRDTAFCKVTGV
jgi:HK97 family phage major capsid protein